MHKDLVSTPENRVVTLKLSALETDVLGTALMGALREAGALAYGQILLHIADRLAFERITTVGDPDVTDNSLPTAVFTGKYDDVDPKIQQLLREEIIERTRNGATVRIINDPDEGPGVKINPGEFLTDLGIKAD